MKSIKRKALGALAVFALTAVFAPTVASASDVVWTDNGKPFTANRVLSLEGNLRFWHPNGGVKCGVAGAAVLEGGKNTGYMGLDIKASNCNGTDAYTFCTVSSVSTSNQFWSIAGSLEVIGTGTYVTFKFESSPWCPAPQEIAYGGGHWMNFDNVTGMSTWTPSGEVSSSQGGSAKIYGTYNLTPAGQYGIAQP